MLHVMMVLLHLSKDKIQTVAGLTIEASLHSPSFTRLQLLGPLSEAEPWKRNQRMVSTLGMTYGSIALAMRKSFVSDNSGNSN